jgi:hypothetical protein
MNWTAYSYENSPYGMWRGRGGMRGGRRMLRGIGRGARAMMRGRHLRRYRRGCCCCPMFLLLGLAGIGVLGGFLVLGMRLLGWA